MKKSIYFILPLALATLFSGVTAASYHPDRLPNRSTEKYGTKHKAVRHHRHSKKQAKHSHDKIFYSAKFAEAIRMQKLANTYREVEDFDNAIRYLDRSRKVLLQFSKDFSARYWLAVNDEMLGYVYRDMDDIPNAKKYIKRALDVFTVIIKQDDGTPLPLELIYRELDSPNVEYVSTPPPVISCKGASDGRIVNYDNQKLQSLPILADDIENLSLSGNRFKEIPAGLYSLENLAVLNLSHNKLRDANLFFKSARDLVWLDLSNNRIRTLSGDFSKMHNLRYLDLSNNSLKTLPEGLEKLKSLETLKLRGNKIPFDVISNLIRQLPKANIEHDIYELKKPQTTIQEDVEE